MVKSRFVFFRILIYFRIDIIHPGARADYPLIRFEFQNIIAFGKRLALSRFRIGEIHKAAAVLLAFLPHVFHVGNAIGVFFPAAHLALGCSVAGMRYADTRIFFISKEISLAFVIAYRAQNVQSQAFGLSLCKFPGLLTGINTIQR